MTITAAPGASLTTNASLTSGRLPKWAPWALLLLSFAISFAVFGVASLGDDLVDFTIIGASIIGILIYMVLLTVLSMIVGSGTSSQHLRPGPW